MENIANIILGVVIGSVIGFMIARISWLSNHMKTRKEIVKQSKSVIMWQAIEQLAPFMPSFPYNPKDMIFVWRGFDYIVFDGLHQKNIKKIVILEIKSKKSSLNKNEMLIRSAVENNKFVYEVIRI